MFPTFFELFQLLPASQTYNQFKDQSGAVVRILKKYLANKLL